MSAQRATSQKAMSSRLMNMKFMQRGSASKSTDSPTQQPSTKRQKTSHDTPTTKLQGNTQTVDEDDSRRKAALERQAEEAGDSQWTLLPTGTTIATVNSQLNVIQTGFGAIDSPSGARNSVESGGSVSEEEDDDHDDIGAVLQASRDAAASLGRKSFGGFTRVDKRPRQTGNDKEDKSDSSDSDEGGDPDNPALSYDDNKNGLKKRRRQHSASEESSPYGQQSTKRREKDDFIKLSRLTSISGGGGGGGAAGVKGSPRSGGSKDVQCFKCGQKGHVKAECPRKGGGGSHKHQKRRT